MTDGPEPISSAEAASLLAPLAGARAVLLAVSGGADSTALLVLAARWAGGAGGPPLHAATVDHGLRPEARGEAERIAALAGRLRVPHRVLAWEGDRPRTGVEAAAREARYRLLLDHARGLGATHLVTAHTRDDQAETVLMRLAAGSGPAGLAAMRPAADREGVAHVRPFLDIPKARLTATLQAEGTGWSEDAMNRDTGFARPRLRAARAALAREGLTDARLATLARRAARADAALKAAAEEARARLRAGFPDGRIDGPALLALPDEIVLRVLAAEIAHAAPDSADGRGVRLERLEALWGALRTALAERRPLGRTLAGALVAVQRDGAVRVVPAPPRRVR